MHIRALAAALLMTAPSAHGAIVETSVTWTGWFSDKGCAAMKVKSGTITPNGTDCVKKCLKNGATPVFLSEQARDMYVVTDYPRVSEDVGYHIEVTGVVDEKMKMISVSAVKRLSEVRQTCAPKRPQESRRSGER